MQGLFVLDAVIRRCCDHPEGACLQIMNFCQSVGEGYVFTCMSSFTFMVVKLVSILRLVFLLVFTINWLSALTCHNNISFFHGSTSLCTFFIAEYSLDSALLCNFSSFVRELKGIYTFDNSSKESCIYYDFHKYQLNWFSSK